LELNFASASSKAGTPTTTLPINISDQTAQTTLSLYSSLIPSVRTWTPSLTILLITSPGIRRSGSRNLSINSCTIIEIDPVIPEAESLRRWAQRENCPINEHFPTSLFDDVDSIIQAPLRLQFTLASLDSFIRASHSQIYNGYLSVILTKLNLVALWDRGHLFSMECCGMPIYANASRGRCEQCGTCDVVLRVNPDVVGEVADETGAISLTSAPDWETKSKNPPGKAIISNGGKKQHSKLLWTDSAWTQLLGCGPEELAQLSDNATGQPATAQQSGVLLRYLEQRLMFVRVILLVGWTGDHIGGRLAVLGVVG
jgi:hypothetical protein